MSRHSPSTSEDELQDFHHFGDETDVKDKGQGVVFVIDWAHKTRKSRGLRPDRKEGEEYPGIVVQRAKKFNDLVKLQEYLDKPCKYPVAIRLIHALNVSNIPDSIRPFFHHRKTHEKSDFRNWAKCGARQKTANPSSFSWDIKYSGYTDLSGDHTASEVACSLDYFGICTDTDPRSCSSCSDDKHAFSLKTSSRHTFTACPRRVSIALRQGRLPGPENVDRVLPETIPAVQLVVSEDYHGITSDLLPHYARWKGVDLGNRRGLTNVAECYGSQLAVNQLSDIFRYLDHKWNDLMDHAIAHSRYLEDRIYMQPDDDSPAQELWATSKNWLTIERLLRAHRSTLSEFESNLQEMREPLIQPAGSKKEKQDDSSSIDPDAREEPSEEDEARRYGPENKQDEVTFYTQDVSKKDDPVFLQKTFKVLDRCSTHVQDDLIKPTTALLDMLYKSVAIRDTRLSLELNASLWRLSWITFIFLPLTFLSGFFGMNVDLFADEPSIKWYFVAALALATVFLIIWILFKLAAKRQNARRMRQRNAGIGV